MIDETSDEHAGPTSGNSTEGEEGKDLSRFPKRYLGGRGFWDPPLTIDEMGRRIKEHTRQLKLLMAQSAETPTRMLGPEAHEDALVAGGNLWKVGITLLAKDSACEVETPNKGRWKLYGGESAKILSGRPETELYIQAPPSVVIDRLDGEDIVRTNTKDFAVTPNGVIKIERNLAHAIGNLPWPPKGLGLERTEIGRDEIDSLRSMLENRLSSRPINT